MPGVLDVLGAPAVRQLLPFWSDRALVAFCRRMQIEKRAVRVEHVVLHGYWLPLPRMRWMMPEKSVPPSPQALCRPNSCAAAAPSGVMAPTAAAASWARRRSFSMRALANPGL